MGCGQSHFKTPYPPPVPRAAAPAAAPAAVPPPKRVRTGTAVIEDLPGEGDGCDRCFGAACDEERCCPSFWLDDGTPPIWPLSWIFGRSNPYLNDNDYVEVLGNCGYKSADRERKALMGTALGFTVFSIVLTVFGCLALSPNPSLTRAAAWAVGHLRSADTGEGTVAYVGLSKLVIVRCADAPAGLDWHEWGACEQASYPWSEVRGLCEIAASRERQAVERAEALEEAGRTGVDYSLLNGRELNFQLGYPCAPLLACSQQAQANKAGALITCVTLLFALVGCLTRIRKKADTNFQKIIGTFPDLIGIITLGGALVAFSAHCTGNMVADKNEVGTGYAAGPGFIGYCFCWVAAVVRFSMHAIMPVPTAGIHVQDIYEAAIDIAEDGKYDGFIKGAKEGGKQPSAQPPKLLLSKEDGKAVSTRSEPEPPTPRGARAPRMV